MKKTYVLVSVLVTAIVLFSYADRVSAASSHQYVPIHLIAGDKYVAPTKAQAVLVDGTTYVPLRYISEALGAKVRYQANPQGVIVSVPHASTPVTVTISNNSEASEAFIRNGRTYIPVRHVVEHLGYRVDYRASAPVVRVFDHSTISTDDMLVQHSVELNQPLPLPAWVPKKSKPKKLAYLTFDDGPGPHEAQLLKVLKEHNVKATFFLVGDAMSEQPAMVKTLHKAGHSIGLHSMTHDKDTLYASPKSTVEEMQATQKVVYGLTGTKPVICRVPYGSKPYMKQPYRDAMVKAGFKMWDWNIDSRDWALPDQPEQILENISTDLKDVPEGEPPVILLHERKVTVELLPKIIKLLEEKGYTLAPYDEKHHVSINFWNDKRL
ncbi:polysaccharide deacetylase family protein [Aureibacillus halotolerans]|uniref:Peptidoglycan/xylan/chitin deacetylase (PgdA/CDA1 family) n=1 Tax=Aureibacillus halotolerans TaxID=1508390 RepID=A0A4V3D5R1_9BACI|nr:polysaccharide deacetylase family protein [Aureibacillus halotolerans]TDQ41007.1 peptidoglycan/xylan/chitin deacetylase (PgdA/CDA1 family) [Aureibacillus halotolerans]